MNASELARYIDHTCLKIQTSPQEIEQICREAREWSVASICIPPSWVKEASALLRGSAVHVGTVIGFPLGYSVSPAKVFEAETAQDDGADEIDIVMHVGRFKAGGHQAVEEELKAIIRATPELTHKIIIECQKRHPVVTAEWLESQRTEIVSYLEVIFDFQFYCEN